MKKNTKRYGRESMSLRELNNNILLIIIIKLKFIILQVQTPDKLFARTRSKFKKQFVQ